jgi:hypothetical protein
MRARAIDLTLAAAILIGSTAAAMASAAVTAQGTLGASGLVLDGRGIASTRIVKVAEISFSTDSQNGVTLSIVSSSLIKAGATPVPFQVVVVPRDATVPTSTAFTTLSGNPYLVLTSSAGVAERDLYIMYRTAALQDPGPYSASIDLDVVDN